LKNKQLPFLLFTLSVFLALILPVLVQDGMFLDGVVYSSIARNLSQGQGSFWALQYSSTLCSPFYDQLPLAIWLQSIFFRLFGDHLFVERLYCFLVALTTAFFIIRIWKTLFRNDESTASMGWLPVLFWIITPVVFWSYTNNMLDNTMAVFDIAAIYLIIKALSTGKHISLRLVIAGAFILAAFLSKGPIGLFPLVSVFIYGLCFRNFSFPRLLKYSAILFVVPVVFLSLMLLTMDNALFSFTEYFGQQVVQSITGQRDLASGRLYIAGRLMTELLIMFILLLSIFVFSRLKDIKPAAVLHNKRAFYFFLITALSGSLPIMVSLKQSGYYLLPSLPFFAMALAIPAAARVEILMRKIVPGSRGLKFATLLTLILLAGTLLFSIGQTGKIRRDKDLVNDIYIMGDKVPHHTSISVCPTMMQDWGLHAYMMRYFSIKLDYRKQYEFYITDKNCRDMVPDVYTKLPVNTVIYEVYQRKE
jgi:4-amino-4-deoxy-L-arabinose transferase-like glycosyltransferase